MRLVRQVESSLVCHAKEFRIDLRLKDELAEVFKWRELSLSCNVLVVNQENLNTKLSGQRHKRK